MKYKRRALKRALIIATCICLALGIVAIDMLHDAANAEEVAPAYIVSEVPIDMSELDKSATLAGLLLSAAEPKADRDVLFEGRVEQVTQAETKSVYDLLYALRIAYPQELGGYDFTLVGEDGLIIGVRLSYDESRQMRAVQADDAALGIARSAQRLHADRIGQVEYVVDAICRVCDYEYGAPHQFEAYGCLVDGKAVCKGYAEAFYACMLHLGVPVEFAYNEERDHVWNTVSVEGENFFVDVTNIDRNGGDALTKEHM